MTSKPTALDWFSGMCWNQAFQAADDGDLQAATVCFAAFGSMLRSHPLSGQPHIARQRRTAYSMAAHASLRVHTANPAHDASLSLASRMIDLARDARTKQVADADMDVLDAQLIFQVGTTAMGCCCTCLTMHMGPELQLVPNPKN